MLCQCGSGAVSINRAHIIENAHGEQAAGLEEDKAKNRASAVTSELEAGDDSDDATEAVRQTTQMRNEVDEVLEPTQHPIPEKVV